MKTVEKWLEEIESQIIVLKEKGRKHHYLIMETMTSKTANQIKKELSKNYTVEIKKCMSCINKWDIVISWT